MAGAIKGINKNATPMRRRGRRSRQKKMILKILLDMLRADLANVFYTLDGP